MYAHIYGDKAGEHALIESNSKNKPQNVPPSHSKAHANLPKRTASSKRAQAPGPRKEALLRPGTFLFRNQAVTCRLGAAVHGESGGLHPWWGKAGFLKGSEEHTPTEFSPGASVAFLSLLLHRFLPSHVWTQKVVSWPNSSRKGQTSNKKSCFVQKGFLYKGVPVFLPKWDYLF